MQKNHTHSGQEASDRSRLTALLSALVLLFPTASYAMLGDAPLVFGIALVLVIGALLPATSVPDSTRSVIYTIVVSLIVTVVLNEVYKVDGDRFFMPLPTEIALPFFIGCGIGFCYMRQNMRTLSAIVLFSFMAFLLQGTCLNDPSANQRLVLPPGFWRNRYVIFGFFSGLTVLCAIPLILLSLPERLVAATAETRQPGRRLWHMVAVLLVVLLSGVFSFTVPPMVDGLEIWMSPMLNRYLRATSGPGLFNDSVNLNQTLYMKNPQNQDRLVFMARGPEMPGYMRGRVFLHYQRGRWQAMPPEDAMRSLPVDSDLAINRYVLRDDLQLGKELPPRRIDVYPTAIFRTDVLFAPANTQVVEVVASRATTNEHGTASPKDWEQQAGYTLFSSDFRSTEAWDGPHLRGDGWQPYLEIPEELRPELAAFNRQVFERPPGNALADVAVVTSFLQAHATYELGAPIEPERDPVLQFVQELRRGHCELFASAAVLLLRQRGVPARYVTGFVVMEAENGKDAWMARLGQAHAWAEAYDAVSGRWLLVEATPAVGVPQGGAGEGSTIAQLMDALRLRWATIFALVKRGYFADAVLTVLREIGIGVGWLFWRGPWYVGWFLAGLVAWLLYRRFGRRRRHTEARAIVDRVARMKALLGELDRALSRLGITRHPHSSIRDLIRLLETTHPQAAPALVPLLQEYELLRYQPSPPAPDACRALAERMRSTTASRERSRMETSA